jgi:hypothetical protein
MMSADTASRATIVLLAQWLVANAIGFAIGSAAGFPSAWIAMWIFGGVLYGVVFASIFCLTTVYSQALVLDRHLGGAESWVLGSVFGWVVVAVLLYFPSILNLPWSASTLGDKIVLGGSLGLIIGGAQWFFLRYVRPIQITFSHWWIWASALGHVAYWVIFGQLASEDRYLQVGALGGLVYGLITAPIVVNTLQRPRRNAASPAG